MRARITAHCELLRELHRYARSSIDDDDIVGETERTTGRTRWKQFRTARAV